jgi:hypothetical protein
MGYVIAGGAVVIKLELAHLVALQSLQLVVKQENKTDKSETAKSSFGRPQSVPNGKVLNI